MNRQAGNKARIRDLLLASDEGDIDRALAYYAPEYVDHDSTEGRRSSSGSALEGLRDGFRLFSTAFSETRHTLHDAIEEGDRLAARISVEAQHTGALWGYEPSGQVVRNDSIVIYRFVDGRIHERWCRERRSTRSLLECGRSAHKPCR